MRTVIVFVQYIQLSKFNRGAVQINLSVDVLLEKKSGECGRGVIFEQDWFVEVSRAVDREFECPIHIFTVKFYHTSKIGFRKFSLFYEGIKEYFGLIYVEIYNKKKVCLDNSFEDIHVKD